MKPVYFSISSYPTPTVSFPVVSKSKARKYLKYVCVAVLLSLSYHSGTVQTARPAQESHPATVAVPMSESLAQAPETAAVENQKTIYFTFDDGPNRGTQKVVDILCQEEMPATFFLVGAHIFGSKTQFSIFENLRSNPCFEAANHSFHHARNRYAQYYKSPEQVLEDFGQMQDSAKLGKAIARTPGMNVWRTVNIKHDADKRSAKAADLLKENGYSLVGWDVEWKAKGKHLKKSPKELAQEIDGYFEEHLTKTKNHLVILLHDQHFSDTNNIKELQALIALLKDKKEYAFKRVSEYPELGN